MQNSNSSNARERSVPGNLIVIGGHEDWDGDRTILTELRVAAQRGRFIICTAASSEPSSLWSDYREVFRRVGVRRADIDHLDVQSRSDASAQRNVDMLDGASLVFFTGGSQARLMHSFDQSPVLEKLRAVHRRGATIAGTSAGAAVIGEHTLTHGPSRRSARATEIPSLRPGLSFLPGVIVDQHFAERGRLGRLIGAVAQNPRMLGLGIDENTAIVVDPATQGFRVIGDGAVYALDARRLEYCNLAPDCRSTLSMFGTRLDLLSHGDRFDLRAFRPAKG